MRLTRYKISYYEYTDQNIICQVPVARLYWPRDIYPSVAECLFVPEPGYCISSWRQLQYDREPANEGTYVRRTARGTRDVSLTLEAYWLPYHG